MDLVYFGLALALWAALAGLAVACARLEPRRSAGRAPGNAGSPQALSLPSVGALGAAQPGGRA